jgi:L-asparaginase
MMPEWDLVEYSPLLDSSDMASSEWEKIVSDIQEHYSEYDGFVVITGTDTMAFIASALSFMLENLAKPVIVTGSQIPICEVHNDAQRNLVLSMIFASRGDFREVRTSTPDK